MTHVLGIFAKQPIAGQVKTRLAAATSVEWATQFAELLVKVTLERFAGIADRRFLAYSPSSGEAYFRDLAAGGYDLVPQGHGNLGQRMSQFFARECVGPADRAVLIGSDSPTLPREHVLQAFELLADHDVVLGPAMDGGYYLVGCRRPIASLFEGITWGGPNVLRDTVRALPASTRLTLLPPWYDVDTLDDCRVLRGHLSAQAQTGGLTDGLTLLLKFLEGSVWLTD